MGARGHHADARGPADGFVPLVVQDLEVADETAPLPEARSGQAHLLLRHHGWPLGQARVSGLCAMASHADWIEAVRRVAPDVLTSAPPSHAASLSEPAATTTSGGPAARRLSVVVATLGVSPQLRQAVTSLLNQDQPLDELIVVDNDPTSHGVSQRLAGIDDTRLRILPEPRLGASHARNTGLANVRTPLVAFVDDDAVPDLDWARRITEVFDCDERIQCVTGLVVPLSLETVEQVWFEEFNGFEKGYRLAVWSPDRLDVALQDRLSTLAHEAGSPSPAVTGRRGVAFPYTAAEFGSGNSMAFRTSALRAIGGFDPALGPGTSTCAGEDLDVFRAIYLSGGSMVYQPGAVVRHHHRRDYGHLRQQVYAYGTGLTAHMTKLVVTRPARLPHLLTRAPASIRVLLSPRSEKNAGKSPFFPADLTRTELRGIIRGPWAYLRSRRAIRRAERSATHTDPS